MQRRTTGLTNTTHTHTPDVTYCAIRGCGVMANNGFICDGHTQELFAVVKPYEYDSLKQQNHDLLEALKDLTHHLSGHSGLPSDPVTEIEFEQRSRAYEKARNAIAKATEGSK